MEKMLTIIAAVLVLAACAQPLKKAEPLVREYLAGQISAPDTYRAVASEVVYRGPVDARFTDYWRHVPRAESFDVVVLRHEFTHDDRSDRVTDDAWFIYLSPSLDTVYYGHRDSGNGLVWER